MSVVETYSLQIILDGAVVPASLLRARLTLALAEAEENLTDLLPDGYHARIRRWDEEGNDDD